MEKTEYKVMYDIELSYWWFVGKQYLISSILRRFNPNRQPAGRVLDIGCGTGIILKLLKGFGAPFGIESSSDAIVFLKKRDLKNIVQSDAGRSIPFKTDTFSVITCLDVLEHLDHDLPLIKEMFRVCKPGGHVLITIPVFNFIWSYHDTALHHKRRYTKQQILARIRGLEWAVRKCSYYNTLFFFPMLATRILKRRLLKNRLARSDFFIRLPAWLNQAMSLLFISEISLLRYLNLPFGVSLVLALQKANEVDLKKD